MPESLHSIKNYVISEYQKLHSPPRPVHQPIKWLPIHWPAGSAKCVADTEWDERTAARIVKYIQVAPCCASDLPYSHFAWGQIIMWHCGQTCSVHTYTFIFHRDSSDAMFAYERWRHHEPQSEPSGRAPEDEQWWLVQTYPHGLHEHAAAGTGEGVRRQHVPVAPAQNWDRVLPPIVRKTGVSCKAVIPRKCLSLSGGLHIFFFIYSFLGSANLRCFRGFSQFQGNAWMLPKVRPRPSPSTSLPVHYLLIILPFDA